MLLIIREERMLLAAPPDPALLDIASNLEGNRRWGKNGLTAETTGHNIEILRTRCGNLEISDRRANGHSETAPPTFYTGEDFKTRPYPHQLEALSQMTGKKSFALFMEQGTGKSKVILDYAAKLYRSGEIRGMLIVAPKGVHAQWIEDQVEKHFAVPFDDWRGGYWGASGVKPGGPRPFGCDLFGLFSINYDALRTEKGRDAAHQFLWNCGHKALLVLDESHFVKNPRSKRWANCAELRRRVPYAVLATGTPIAKDLCDEWAQLKLLDERILGIRYITHFRNEYCLMGGYEGKKVIGSRNLERFKSKTAPFIYRTRKSEIGIEPKQYSTFQFDMTPKQKETYKRLAKEMLVEIEEGEYKTVENAGVKVMRLQQISNGYVDYKDHDPNENLRIEFFGENDKDNPRIEALLTCLGTMEGESVIVWSRFQYDVEVISRAFRAEGISFVQYYGPTPDKTRAANIEAFLSGEAQILVATAATGGVGLNLQGRCANAIYYSNSENSVQRWQSEDRIHRIGIQHPVTYTDLIARGSRDMPILANLRHKKSLSDMTLDDLRRELEAIA